MKLLRISTNLALLALCFLNFQRAFASSNVQDSEVISDAVDSKPDSSSLEQLSLETKIGQLLFVGISDTELSARTTKDLMEIKPGAIILFKRNVTSAKKTALLNKSLQDIGKKYFSLPLILATDQEGGRVARIETLPSMPSPLALGKTKSEKVVEAVSFEVGKILHLLGFNMNLAPVLDVLNPSGASFIGERSFGNDFKLVGELGLAFAQGQLRAGIIPAAKHFPGAGQLTKDPHVQKVSIEHASTSGLEPFRQFAGVFPSAVMMSHSSYPAFDQSGSAATFSNKIISDLLKIDLNYRGLIITDDLQMGAVKNGDIGQLAVRSFKAGADLLMITWGPREQKQVKESLLQAVRSGEISLAEINQRVQKIISVKRLILSSPRIPSSVDDEDSFYSKRLGQLDEKILRYNISSDLKKISSPTFSERYVVVGKSPQFKWAFERTLGKTVASLSLKSFYDISNSKKSAEDFENKYDCVVLPIYSHKEALLLGTLDSSFRKKILAVNFTSPGLIDEKPLRGVINLYHPHAETGRVLAEFFRNQTNR